MNENALFYSNLYKLLEEDEDDYENCCLIDGQVLDKDCIELKCKHTFNYLSLLNEIQSQKKKIYWKRRKLKILKLNVHIVEACILEYCHIKASFSKRK